MMFEVLVRCRGRSAFVVLVVLRLPVVRGSSKTRRIVQTKRDRNAIVEVEGNIVEEKLFVFGCLTTDLHQSFQVRCNPDSPLTRQLGIRFEEWIGSD